ncbi:MAG TPA: lecithin retinol acyltransferase family protein, partial [Coleofasciculaceae cyanobacterium]
MARGDQIYIIIEFLNIQGVYEHHGIDCGDGSVIHLRKRTETIERTPFAAFVNDAKSKVYVRHYPTCFIPDVVVRRAESRLGERKY